MRKSRTLISFAAAAALASAGMVAAPTLSADAAVAPAKTLHFKVNIGPGGSQVCDIVGDLYLPETASSTNRVPAILTTNGFGGSKDDQAGLGKAFAAQGYAVLSYSGLGFGGSGCKITLDDPDYDGVAAKQLVSYLGGSDGIAYTDAQHTTPAPALDVVTLDAKDHNGVPSVNDPRVGMVGGSYGGQIQYAAASVDPRIDTIIPIITWSDLSYSLAPNNTSQTTGVSTSTPGSAKSNWALGFSALGVVNGVERAQDDPARLVGCPNFADFVCPALSYAASTGTVDPPTTAALRHASVSSYISKVKIPTLILQGQGDTLFNINEAVANYNALKKQGTVTKMVWQHWGHSESKPAPGEIDIANPDPATQYETKRISDWFDHYLKGASVGTGPAFSYFRDWIDYTGIATPAYADAPSFPVGSATKYYLSGTGLRTSSIGIAAGSQSLVTPVTGAPTSTDPADVVGDVVPLAENDAPGTAVSWTSPALVTKVDVVGIPTVNLRVSSPSAAATQSQGPTGQLVLFLKLVDVAPDGSISLIHKLIAPVRVPDVNQAFTVTLPGIAHRFAAGHSIRLTVAGGSTNYRGGLTSNPVTISTGTTGQALTLPIVK